MLAILFRVIFSLSVIIYYSMGVWTMITDYFNKEFRRLLLNGTNGDDFDEDEEL